jgi:hypothetical protein
VTRLDGLIENGGKTTQDSVSNGARGRGVGAVRRSALSSCQLVEQRLCLFQIERVEAFAEPAVDWSEKLARHLPLGLVAPEPRRLA